MRKVTRELPTKRWFSMTWIVGFLMLAGCDNSSRSPSGHEIQPAGSTPASSVPAPSTPAAKSKLAPTSSEARRPIPIRNDNWQKEVLDYKGLVLVDFWAPWCGPCRMMDPILESLVKEYKVCKVNVDENRELAQEFRAESIPLLLIFKDGKKVFTNVGYTPNTEATLRAELKKHARHGG